MSFRKEIKLILNPRNSFDFKKMILKKGAKIIYPKRKVSSLYLDNSARQCHKDSLEGSLPRKKIRIRSYPDGKNKEYLFEKKISSPEGRFKSSKRVTLNFCNRIIKNGYFDKIYGLLLPLIYVDYSREYYKLDNFRITIDQDIHYSVFNKSKVRKDTKSVVELKFSQNNDEDSIINSFPNKLTRFSKYSNGIELLKL